MADLIDRQAVSKSLKEFFKAFVSDEYTFLDPVNTSAMVQQVISDVPMEDAEPVVRCKDCKWYRNGECFCNDVWFNLTGDSEGVERIEANPDDFCSYGERRD